MKKVIGYTKCACCLGWESVFPLQEMHRISEMLPDTATV